MVNYWIKIVRSFHRGLVALGAMVALVGGCEESLWVPAESIDVVRDDILREVTVWRARKAQPGGQGHAEAEVGAREAGQVCVVSHFNEDIRHFAEVTTDNHRAYAARHGYLYHAFVGELSEGRFLMPFDSDPVKRDGLYWQAFVAVERALAWQDPSGHPTCDWVMWVDADAIFTDFSTSVGQLMARMERVANFRLETKDILLSSEQLMAGAIINAGVFMLRNTDGSKEFLSTMTDRFEQVKDACWADQRAMHDVAFSSGEGGWHPHDLDASLARLRPDAVVLPQRVMDSFCAWPGRLPREVHANAEAWSWSAGDFIAHFAGRKEAARIALMCEMARHAPGW